MGFQILVWWALTAFRRQIASPKHPLHSLGPFIGRFIWPALALSFFFVGSVVAVGDPYASLAAIGAFVFLAVAAGSPQPARSGLFAAALAIIAVSTFNTVFVRPIGEPPNGQPASVVLPSGFSLSDQQLQYCLFDATATTDEPAVENGIDMFSERSQILDAIPLPPGTPPPVLDGQWLAWFDQVTSSARSNQTFVQGCYLELRL